MNKYIYVCMYMNINVLCASTSMKWINYIMKEKINEMKYTQWNKLYEVNEIMNNETYINGKI
jgi:hypothetical protein